MIWIRLVPQPLPRSKLILWIRYSTFKDLNCTHVWLWNQYNVITVATGKWAAWPRNCGLIPGRNKRFISYSKLLDKLWDPPSLLSVGKQGCVARSTVAEAWTDHSPPSSAEVKNVSLFTFTRSYVCTACTGTTSYLYICNYTDPQ